MRALVVLTILITTWSCNVAAITRVNVCHNDFERVAGRTNLAQALSIGGQISIDCPSGSILRITGSHGINKSVSIAGQGVTLQFDTAALPAFSIGAAGKLRLSNATLRGNGAIPEGRSVGLTTFLVGSQGILQLEKVKVHKLARPALVMKNGRALIVSGDFENGNDPIRVDGGHVDISGDTSFVQWTTAVSVLSGTVTISKTKFRRSRLVLEDCTFAIADSEFSFSDVSASGLSGGAIDTNCSGRIERSVFTNNSAVNGGAINLRGATDLALFRVRFIQNSATANGGAISNIKYNSLRSQRIKMINMNYVVFRGNSGENGGAIYLPSDKVKAHAAHFADNVAHHTAGAVYCSKLQMNRGTFVGNRATIRGGAIYSFVPQHPSPGLVVNVISNSLVVKNSAPEGAGIYGSAMKIINSTIADNVGSGISGGSAKVYPAAITLTNTLLVANSDGNCGPTSGNDGVISTVGPNLEFPVSTCPGATLTDPTLDPLYSPMIGSPALDAADLQICKSPPVQERDVYGEPRPQGKGCSIGAVENAVDRLVVGRLLREQSYHEPEGLLDKIKEAASRLRSSQN